MTRKYRTYKVTMFDQMTADEIIAGEKIGTLTKARKVSIDTLKLLSNTVPKKKYTAQIWLVEWNGAEYYEGVIGVKKGEYVYIPNSSTEKTISLNEDGTEKKGWHPFGL